MHKKFFTDDSHTPYELIVYGIGKCNSLPVILDSEC